MCSYAHVMQIKQLYICLLNEKNIPLDASLASKNAVNEIKSISAGMSLPPPPLHPLRVLTEDEIGNLYHLLLSLLPHVPWPLLSAFHSFLYISSATFFISCIITYFSFSLLSF